ncbi:MAG: cysteine synthase family protein [Cyclobacteriaceae bacterium]
MITLDINSKLIDRTLEIGKYIGNTPLFEIKNLVKKENVKVFAKLEWNQLSGSVKARPAYEIIKEAVLSGELNEHKTLLDASSGNTAIAYAAIGAAIGLPVTICLPENASEERKQILKAYGAEIILTSKFGTTDESQEKALELYENNPLKYFYADQYNNENNWKAHYRRTGVEILNQTNREVTHFVAGLGTTGTFTGTSQRLKEELPEIKAIALEPDEALHGLEGWKHLETARVPGIFREELIDQRIPINTYEALGLMPGIASNEGLLVSPSAAANLLGALEVARSIDEGVIVTIFPDNAEKYGEVLKSLF